jgi:TetR/AcrR family transcriptional regulator
MTPRKRSHPKPTRRGPAPRRAPARARTRARAPSPPELRRRAAMDGEIVAAAEELFARDGFHGVSVAEIAARVGMSKQNLLYYFPTKEALYKRVLDGVLDDWLSRMDAFAAEDHDPESALRAYISAKLRYSRERPSGSRVYANEIIAGAPLYAREIEARVVPALRAQVATLSRWASEGRIEPVDPVHLMFVLWASTQTYADFSRQMELVMGKPALCEEDFRVAEELLTGIVLRAVGIRAAAPARAAAAAR